MTDPVKPTTGTAVAVKPTPKMATGTTGRVKPIPKNQLPTKAEAVSTFMFPLPVALRLFGGEMLEGNSVSDSYTKVSQNFKQSAQVINAAAKANLEKAAAEYKEIPTILKPLLGGIPLLLLGSTETAKTPAKTTETPMTPQAATKEIKGSFVPPALYDCASKIPTLGKEQQKKANAQFKAGLAERNSEPSAAKVAKESFQKALDFYKKQSILYNAIKELSNVSGRISK